jgi:inhibitor of cysteine peptidase
MDTLRLTKAGVLCCGAMAAAVLLAAVALAACGTSSAGSGGSSSPAPLGTAVGVSLSPGGGKTESVGVAVQAGGQVSISVAENPTTGYRWSLDLPSGVTQVTSAFAAPSASPSPMAGAGGTRTFVVKVALPGVYDVSGAYARPWESEKPAETFVVQIFAPPPSQPGLTRFFTAKDSPGSVTADVGSVFAVVLEENPSTGYSWTMKIGPGLELMGDRFVAPSPSPSPLAGAGGQRIWVIGVRKAGETAVTGIYARPADAATKSSADFSLSVHAQ